MTEKFLIRKIRIIIPNIASMKMQQVSLKHIDNQPCQSPKFKKFINLKTSYQHLNGIITINFYFKDPGF
jgi:hypothetical protein